MRALRPECIEKPKVDGCQAWVFRFVKLVYRLGGVYFILTRTQTAQNFMRWLVKLCTGSGVYIIFLKPRTSAIGFSKYNIYPLAFARLFPVFKILYQRIHIPVHAAHSVGQLRVEFKLCVHYAFVSVNVGRISACGVGVVVEILEPMEPLLTLTSAS